MYRNERTYIVAEIGGNHNGDFNKAIEMVYAAKEAGADAAKFQIYKPDRLVHKMQETLPILKGKYRNQLERFESLCFKNNEVEKLHEKCDSINLDFLATPFDRQSVDLLESLVNCYKIASGDINNIPFIKYIIKKNKDIIVSSGMAVIEEIDRIYDLVPKKHLSILHCVSLYPTPRNKANLNTIIYLKRRYKNIRIGYSDHTIGMTACISAVALGAKIIEKHFTFDKNIEYGDHILSADYREMELLIKEIRNLEEMLGEKKLIKSKEEMENRKFFRRGIYAAKKIYAGSLIELSDIKIIRPPASICPEELTLVVKKRARNDIDIDAPILVDDLI